MTSNRNTCVPGTLYGPFQAPWLKRSVWGEGSSSWAEQCYWGWRPQLCFRGRAAPVGLGAEPSLEKECS